MKLLIVDDRPDVSTLLAYHIRRLKHEPVVVETCAEALARFRDSFIDGALLDIELRDGSGLELLARFRQQFPDFPAVFITSSAAVEDVVRAMKQGALDYLTKPIELPRLEVALAHMERIRRLQGEVRLLREAVRPPERFERLIGRSPEMRALYTSIENVARSSATVLILGESGTGKELVASAIHARSRRMMREMVAINCAAIPRDLLESELFGHERGSFTGAHSRRVGCFERASGSTLFLDEIAEMDIGLQAKLLRVLQEQRFYRIGGNELIQVDVRIIAATNRDPLAYVRQGLFREDLYYRLGVVTLRLPPLRERREDIALIAQHLLEEISASNGRRFTGFTRDAMELLSTADWPGNVRHLRNVVEQIVVLNEGPVVTSDMLSNLVRPAPSVAISAPPPPSNYTGTQSTNPAETLVPLEELERREIQRALVICEGNITEVAKRLGISQATLYRKIEKYQLDKSRRRRTA